MDEAAEMGPLQTATLSELIDEIFSRNRAAIVVTLAEKPGNSKATTHLLRTHGPVFTALGLAVFAHAAIQQQVFKMTQQAKSKE